MSGNRGLANQALFQARILLDGWEHCAEAQLRSADQLAAAFRPAVLLHLRNAYGWFLLAVAGLDTEPDPMALPREAGAVPEPPPGRTVAPELREFALLERDAWLGDMLNARHGRAGMGATQGLLGSDQQPPGIGEFQRWCDALEQVMHRMDDSLDEC
mgnify:CR=1 FL=1